MERSPTSNTFTPFNLLENFSHSKTPFHFIVISCIITLTTTAGFEFTDEKENWWKWYIIFATIGGVLLLSILITFSAKYEITEVGYDKQMRFARSIGISSAILCFLFAGERVIDDDGLFLFVAMPSIVQIATFFIYIFVKEDFIPHAIKQDTETELTNKKINYLQLCLITTSLLIGIATTAHLDKRYGEPLYGNVLTLLLWMWVLCIVFWIVKLFQKTTIVFKVQGNYKNID